MAPILFVAALCLLALPGGARRLGRHLTPAEWSRTCAGALVAGAALLEFTVLLYAAPTILRACRIPELADLCERALGALVPAGAALGWPAALAGVAFPVLTVMGAARARRQQAAVHVEACLGEHRHFDGHALVVLPTESVVAFCSSGVAPQIVVSEGLVDALPPGELTAVLRHEAAHLEHGHQRFLILASALERSLGVLPFVRRSASALRTSLERWADETAVADCREARSELRRALLGVTTAVVNAAVPAFSAAETVAERLDALGNEPPQPTLRRRAVAYAPAAALSATVLATLGAWAGEAGHVLAWSSHCPT